MNTIQKTLGLAALVGAVALTAPQAQAVPVLGGSMFVAADGHVLAKFIGQTAGYDNELYLHSPANALGMIFHNHLNSPGDMMDLGFFSAGTELIFKIYVVNTGDTFYSGDGSLNPDSMPHAIVDAGPAETLVGFEDLFGGGDLDYDDTVFSFTNVKVSPVPDASSTLSLLGAAMAGVAALRRRFNV